MPGAPAQDEVALSPRGWWTAGRRQVLTALLIAICVGGTLWLTGWLERVQTALHDVQARSFKGSAPAAGAMVVDIDEASLTALREQFGGWPPRRDLLALASEYLIDIGARVVAIDLVLADPRLEDLALAQAIERSRGRIVLAAAATATPVGAVVVPGPAGTLPPGCMAHAWGGVLLPSPALGAGALQQGLISTTPDRDGQVRALAPFHVAQAVVLPTLPLAMWMAARGGSGADVAAAVAGAPGGAGRVDVGVDGRGDGLYGGPADKAVYCEPGLLRLGDRSLPLDGAGRLRPIFLPAAGPAEHTVPVLPFATVAQAALGSLDDTDLRTRVAGRAVLIGASAGLGDVVQTPAGPRSGAVALAEIYDALEHGRVFRPPDPKLDATLLLLACVPGLAALRRGGMRLRPDILWCAGTLLLLVGLDIVAALQWLQLSHPTWPFLTVLGFAAMSLLSEQRALQAAARRLTEEREAAQAASRLKSEFLAHMSHELRTPLNALLGSAELLAGTALDMQQRRHVALFQSAGAGLLQTLNDLLDLSKIEAGLLELNEQPFSLVELIAAQIVLFEASAAQKGLPLQTELDPDLPTVVAGDPQRLAQVLRNLLGNAIKFTREGSVLLVVKRAEGDTHRLRFEVRDTGVGIPAERQDAVFRPFEQADSGVTRTYGGTGLGLTISRRLVQLMGGTIGLWSVEGEGTTFHVELPLPASREKPTDDWVHSVPITDRGPLPALRILLADDNSHNVFLVQAYLEGEGHEIDVVHEGQSAVELCARTRYDVVLMDVQMPGMDGYSATAAIREHERRHALAAVPVIALTANALADDQRRSLEAGCDAHLSKPFTRQQLRNLLASYAELQGVLPAPPAPALPPEALRGLAALDGLDLQSALERMGGNVELYVRVATAAAQMLVPWNRQLADALARRDVAAAKRHAHDLKAMAGVLGAQQLSRAAGALEDAVSGRGDGDVSALRSAVERRLGPLLHELLALEVPPAP